MQIIYLFKYMNFFQTNLIDYEIISNTNTLLLHPSVLFFEGVILA